MPASTLQCRINMNPWIISSHIQTLNYTSMSSHTFFPRIKTVDLNPHSYHNKKCCILRTVAFCLSHNHTQLVHASKFKPLTPNHPLRLLFEFLFSSTYHYLPLFNKLDSYLVFFFLFSLSPLSARCPVCPRINTRLRGLCTQRWASTIDLDLQVDRK